jgi:protein STU2
VGFTSPTHDDAGIYRDGSYGPASANRNRISFASTLSEEKENGETTYPRSKLSPELRYASSGVSSGRGSPARGFRSANSGIDDVAAVAGQGSTVGSGGAGGVESWKRAAEVTSQLKARIEQMKVRETRILLEYLSFL